MSIDFNTNFNVYEAIKHNPGITSSELRKHSKGADSFKKSISYLTDKGSIYYDHKNKQYFTT